MKMFKALTASVVMAAAIVGASASQASTLVSNFNQQDGSFWYDSAPYGSVTVNDAGGVLAFTVDLDDGLKFYKDSSYSFAFNLDNLSGVKVSNIDSDTRAGFTFAKQTVSESPFGNFTLAMDCTSNCSSYRDLPSTLTFTVSGSSALTIDDLFKNSKGDYFAASVTDGIWSSGTIAANAATITRTGGGPAGAVPEPATWAIMLMGFGGLGAALRQRRGMAFARA